MITIINVTFHFAKGKKKKKTSFVSFETLCKPLNWSKRIVNIDINGAEFPLVGEVNLGFSYYPCPTHT